MEEIKVSVGDTIEDAVELLQAAKAAGRHVYCYCNDVKLYSDNVTLDSAYKAICGCTKAEQEQKLNEYYEESKKIMEQKKQEAIESIPSKIEMGKQFIYPFRHEEWADLVKADADGDYTGLITTHTLEIIEAIEQGKTVDELVEIFKEQGHSGRTAYLTRCAVMNFSKYGYPFYKAVRNGEWTVDECENILRLMQENEEYGQELGYANRVFEARNELNAIINNIINSYRDRGQRK